MRTEARSNCGGGRARLSERHGRAVLGGRGEDVALSPCSAGPPGALPIDLAPPPLGHLAGHSHRAAAHTACCPPPPRERSLQAHPCPASPLPSRPAACPSAVESRLHRAAWPRRLGRSHGERGGGGRHKGAPHQRHSRARRRPAPALPSGERVERGGGSGGGGVAHLT